MTIVARAGWWTLIDADGGALATVYGEPPQHEQYPSAARAVAVPRPPDPQSQVWTGTAWIDSLARLDAILISPIKAEAERRRMLVRSPGAGKAAEYRQKATEAHASATATATALNALTASQAVGQFPAAANEAALTGEPLATVLARYRKRATESDAETFRLAAIEAAAVAAIRAAATGAAKRAAAAAVNWDWKAA